MSAASVPVGSRKRGFSLGRVLIYVFCTVTALLWLVPLVGALFASLRPYQDTIQHGFFSWPDTIYLDNYRRAWDQGNILHHYWNTALILVPSLIVTLFFSSMVAFICSR